MSVKMNALLLPGWDSQYSASEVRRFGIATFMTSVLIGKLQLVVNGADLSWDNEIPILDHFAAYFWAIKEVKLKATARFISPDLEPLTILRFIQPDRVRVEREDTPIVGECAYSELSRAIGGAGVRLYDRFVTAYPAVLENEVFGDFYPIDGLRAASREG